jgi:Domain of unknown function (DUF4157)
VDSAETQEHVDVERSRAAPVPEIAAPDQVHDQRGPVERLASGMGNRNFGQMIARMGDGEGILAGGRVHPDVQAAIAASKGGGRPLTRSVSDMLGSSLGDSMGDVRVHTGDGAAALARAVSARAFTVGSDIFFGAGEYNPGTPAGDHLLRHEAAHALQQRDAPTSGPLTVSQPGDALEREAEAAAHGHLA